MGKEPWNTVSFFFSRNRIILKASSACCGQSDSSQHWTILGSGEESKAAGTPGTMVQVFYRRRGPQIAHLRYHLYVGAMLNCLIFCFGFLISWIGFCCLQEDLFFEIKRMREHHLHPLFLWRMNFGKEGWAVTLKLNLLDLWELCRLLKYSKGVYFKSEMWRQSQKRVGWNRMRFPSGCPGHRCEVPIRLPWTQVWGSHQAALNTGVRFPSGCHGHRCDSSLTLMLHHWSPADSSNPPATSLSPPSGPGFSPSPWMCFLLFLFIYFIFCGCTGSSRLCTGFHSLRRVGGSSSLQYAGDEVTFLVEMTFLVAEHRH